jgi:hypothetical protein
MKELNKYDTYIHAITDELGNTTSLLFMGCCLATGDVYDYY